MLIRLAVTLYQICFEPARYDRQRMPLISKITEGTAISKQTPFGGDATGSLIPLE
jgi:hypothetical protein